MFLVGPGRTTLPITILQYLEYRIDPTIAAVSVLQILLIGGGHGDHRPLREAVAGGVRRGAARARAPVQAFRRRPSPCTTSRSMCATASSSCCWGPSGCGKTTTLRMIAGFVAPTAGRVRLGGQDVTALPPWRRNAGMVFQSYALFPHLTVAQNVAFGLEMRKMPQRGDRRARRRGAAAGAAGRPERAPAAPALGRAAAARGAGARAGDPPRRAAAGRAAVEPGRQAPRNGAGGDPRAAAPARHHHGDGHARPGRGADHGRPAGRDVRGLGAPGRLAARPLRAPGRPRSWRASSAAATFCPAR